MEMKLTVHDPLYDEVKAEAQKCGMTPSKFALEVIESFAAARRFWRIDQVSETVGTSREIEPSSIPGLDICANSSTDCPRPARLDTEAQPVTAEPCGFTGCVNASCPSDESET